MLGAGFFLKIAKINSQRGKPMCPIVAKISFSETEKNPQSAKINSRNNFVPHGTPSQLVLYRPSIIIIISLQSQFKQFYETRGLGWFPGWELPGQRGYFFLLYPSCLLSVLVNFRFHTIHYFYLVQVLWQPSMHLQVSRYMKNAKFKELCLEIPTVQSLKNTRQIKKNNKNRLKH